MSMLDGKVAIVTGAGRGIGRAHALALAAQGAQVVVNDLGGADDVVDEITSGGGAAAANTDDVSSWAGGQGIVQQAIDTYGKLDVLVNNAGILRDKMSFNMEESDWDAVIAVHLKGHFAPSRAAAIYWRERSKAGEPVAGRIINTSSEAGLFGNAGQANYSAAKAGIGALTVVLARELGRYGVTANAIAPRARTQMTEQIFAQFGAPPEGEFDALAPENISPLVAWLASDDAADVTGQVFIVWGDTVQVLQEWQVAGQIAAGGKAWTPDGLAAAKGELFAKRDPGVPGFPVGA